MNNKPSILFLTLRTFSLVGGIENVCKAIAYSLQQLAKENTIQFELLSMYDDKADEKYINLENFEGFNSKIKKGSLVALKKGIKADVVILSHINLSIIALVIKLFSPKTKIILWTHGIEIWRPLSFLQQLLLKKVDTIVAVSEFTKQKIIKNHQIAEDKIKVLHNSLDPYFNIPTISNIIKDEVELPYQAPFFIALCRLKLTEQRKKYDLIIKILGELKREGYPAFYFICGKYDQEEFDRIKQIAIGHDVANEIILPGFVSENQLQKYYAQASAFIMPSEKEGFGLVFIEAQASGLRVLCGNTDGSIETLKSKDSGIAINPNDESIIKETLINFIQHPLSTKQKSEIQNTCLAYFKFEIFHQEIKKLIASTTIIH